MKIATWNINGIRSLPRSVQSYLNLLDAEVVCFQETKLARESLDSSIAFTDGYSSFFGFCRTKRTGYSGVATYCSTSSTPNAAEEGLTNVWIPADESATLVGGYGNLSSQNLSESLKNLDGEGRAVITQHRIRNQGTGEEFQLCLFNVYCPRFDPDRPERWQFKMDFYRLLEHRAKSLRRNNVHTLILGDLNVSRKRLDHCDPDSDPEFDLQEHRIWINQFLLDSETNPDGEFVDLFRYFHEDEQEAFSCWNMKIGARKTNFGTRIDYAICDRDLLKLGAFQDCIMRPDIQGSDHCPVVVTFQDCWNFVPSIKLPQLCSKFLSGFSGKQQSLRHFLIKNSAAEEPKKKIMKKDSSSSKPQQKTLKSFFAKETSDSSTSDSVRYRSGNESSPSCSSSQETPSEKSSDSCNEQWKLLFRGPPKAPMCKGHKEKCVLRTVKKDGANKNRQFWVCSRGEGAKNNPEARCDHFEWVLKS